jgi:hypothetical protein
MSRFSIYAPGKIFSDQWPLLAVITNSLTRAKFSGSLTNQFRHQNSKLIRFERLAEKFCASRFDSVRLHLIGGMSGDRADRYREPWLESNPPNRLKAAGPSAFYTTQHGRINIVVVILRPAVTARFRLRGFVS